MSAPFKHTPGPWEAVSNSWSHTTISAVGGPVVAAIDIYDEAQEETQDDMEAVMTANARLMASSPKLLAALIGLEAAVSAMHDNMNREERHAARLALTAAREAIAAATGEV